MSMFDFALIPSSADICAWQHKWLLVSVFQQLSTLHVESPLYPPTIDVIIALNFEYRRWCRHCATEWRAPSDMHLGAVLCHERRYMSFFFWWEIACLNICWSSILLQQQVILLYFERFLQQNPGQGIDTCQGHISLKNRVFNKSIFI